ncbi:MAG: hypothetical protein A3G23_04390 [Bacteroidetes bacterium RIFCSPLOWO2_12_FULL_37_12]|nr:MAG: hypothetical protein A3G23_04390 [Bacteroidetes bacterium RIFCSPLOWO2_12_FULL_37_12]
MNESCLSIKYTNHAIEFMAKRGITEEEVEFSILKGETIESYPEDKPFPSKLILTFVNGRPIHIVLARDEKSKKCFVVTAYEPTLDKFELNYKTRKRRL